VSTAVYGFKERAQLAVLADQLAATPAAGILGPLIADTLRKSLPDMGDVAIGRVLVALATEMPQLFQAVDEGAATATVLWQGLAEAGLNLTKDEWDDPSGR
jgi:hypothetical protein